MKTTGTLKRPALRHVGATPNRPSAQRPPAPQSPPSSVVLLVFEQVHRIAHLRPMQLCARMEQLENRAAVREASLFLFPGVKHGDRPERA